MQRRVSVLGRVRYSSGGRDISVSGALASVLGYLAVHASSGRRVTRDRIAFSLWPDRTEQLARRALADALYRIAQLVDDDELIVRSGDLIGLGDAVVDLDEFVKLASQSDTSAQRAALDIYDDDLLVDVDADWVTGQREATRLQLLTVLQSVWAFERSVEENGWGIATAQRWAQIDPWDEQAHRAVLRSLAASGQLNRAAAYFDWLVKMLEDEFGVGPNADTQAVGDHIDRETKLLLARSTVVASQSPFVGRIAERATLIRRLDEAVAGSGGLTVLLGDAGMGKSRLLNELSIAARWRGADASHRRVDEFSLAEPGAPLLSAVAQSLTSTRRAQLTELVDARWLRHVEVRLAGGTSSESHFSESHFSGALPRVLAGLGAIAPQVLLLDDMQWADPEAWSLLDALQPHLTDMAIQIVVAARLGELRGQADAWSMVRKWDQAGVPVIELTGMSADELGQLSAAASGVSLLAEDTVQLQSATSGNPLFALALIESHSTSAAPKGLADLLDRQLGSVSKHARTALDVAALIGFRFSYERWRDALSLAEASVSSSLVDASTELERSRLLVVEPSGLRFAHDTLRSHVIAALTPGFRQVVHAALLDVVRSTAPDDVLDALRHADGADDDAAIAELSIEAGLLALDGGVYAVAAGHFERSLSTIGAAPVDPAGRLSRFVALLGLTRALDVLGDRDGQRQAIDELQSLGAALGDRRHVEALRMSADFAFIVGDYPTAKSTAEQGLVLLAAEPDRALEAALLQTSSLTARELGDYAEAELLAERCQGWYVELGDRSGAATMTDALGGLAWRTGDKGRAAALHAEAAREFGAIGAFMAQARALNNLGTAQWDLGRFHDAWATHAEAVEVCRDLGDVRGEGDNIDNMGGVRWALGDMAGAIELYETALALRRGSDDPWGVAISLGNLADAHRSAGDLDRSLACAAEALSVSRAAGIARTEATSLQAIGATLLELGQIGEALDALAEADAAHVELGDRNNSVETRGVRARTLLAAADVAGAQALADELLSSLQPDDSPSLRQSVHQCAYECTLAPEHLTNAQAAMAEYLAPFDSADRDRIVAGHPLHRRTCDAVAAQTDRVVVHIAAVGTPLGRALTDEDRVAVTWTVSEPADSATVDLALRRRRVIARLLVQAAEQGGAPTDDDLAAALGVSRRTIIRDMEVLAGAGEVLATRRRAARS